MAKKLTAADCDIFQQSLGEVEKELAANGRVVLRASGNGPVVRVMIESCDPALVVRLGQQLADTVKRAAEEAA